MSQPIIQACFIGNRFSLEVFQRAETEAKPSSEREKGVYCHHWMTAKICALIGKIIAFQPIVTIETSLGTLHLNRCGLDYWLREKEIKYVPLQLWGKQELTAYTQRILRVQAYAFNQLKHPALNPADSAIAESIPDEMWLKIISNLPPKDQMQWEIACKNFNGNGVTFTGIKERCHQDCHALIEAISRANSFKSVINCITHFKHNTFNLFYSIYKDGIKDHLLAHYLLIVLYIQVKFPNNLQDCISLIIPELNGSSPLHHTLVLLDKREPGIVPTAELRAETIVEVKTKLKNIDLLDTDKIAMEQKLQDLIVMGAHHSTMPIDSQFALALQINDRELKDLKLDSIVQILINKNDFIGAQAILPYISEDIIRIECQISYILKGCCIKDGIYFYQTLEVFDQLASTPELTKALECHSNKSYFQTIFEYLHRECIRKNLPEEAENIFWPIFKIMPNSKHSKKCFQSICQLYAESYNNLKKNSNISEALKALAQLSEFIVKVSLDVNTSATFVPSNYYDELFTLLLEHHQLGPVCKLFNTLQGKLDILSIELQIVDAIKKYISYFRLGWAKALIPSLSQHPTLYYAMIKLLGEAYQRLGSISDLLRICQMIKELDDNHSDPWRLRHALDLVAKTFSISEWNKEQLDQFFDVFPDTVLKEFFLQLTKEPYFSRSRVCSNNLDPIKCIQTCLKHYPVEYAKNIVELYILNPETKAIAWRLIIQHMMDSKDLSNIESLLHAVIADLRKNDLQNLMRNCPSQECFSILKKVIQLKCKEYGLTDSFISSLIILYHSKKE